MFQKSPRRNLAFETEPRFYILKATTSEFRHGCPSSHSDSYSHCGAEGRSHSDVVKRRTKSNTDSGSYASA